MKFNTFSLLAIAGYAFCLFQIGYILCWTTNDMMLGGLFPHLFIAASPFVGWALGRLGSEDDD